MNRQTILVAAVLFLSCCTFAEAQVGANLHELSIKILKDSNERDLDSLLQSLSSFDGGNYNLVGVRGMLPAGAEPIAKFKQVLQDERLRKAYEKLKTLDKKEAARIVGKSFDADLSKIKRVFGEKQGYVDPLIYGLHAKLWLASEFGETADFNRRFREWNDWSVQVSVKQANASRFVGPEMLMYLNLVLLEEKRSGVTIKASQVRDLFSQFELAVPFEHSVASFPLLEIGTDGDKSQNLAKLAEVTIFRFWNGLDILDVEERSRLMLRAGAIIDPQLKQRLRYMELKDRLYASIKENFLGKWLINSADKLTPKPPMLLQLVANSSKPVDFEMQRGWNAEHPPSKDDLLYAIDVILNSVKPGQKAQWDEPIELVRDWLSKLPEEGIEAGKKRVYHQWPKDSEQLGHEIPRIRLSLRSIKALGGKLTKEEPQSDSGD